MAKDLFEHETEENLTREQAAAKLRELADALASQNSVRVVEKGLDVTVKVGDRVDYEFEIETEEDGSYEIEIKLKWEK